jgi:hypothetical protein
MYAPSVKLRQSVNLLIMNIGVNVSITFIHEQRVFIESRGEFWGQYLHVGYRVFSSNSSRQIHILYFSLVVRICATFRPRHSSSG